MLVVRRENDGLTRDVVDTVRSELNKPPRKTLHFRDLKHDQRVYYIGEITKQPARQVSVCVHKPSLKEQESFRERYRLYFYATRYLLERISWLARDNRRKNDPNDGTVKLVFSNRAGMVVN